MTTECPLCSRGIEHCHGSLVVHSDGTAECTEITCVDLQFDRHELVLECHRLATGCVCVPVEVRSAS